jgi:hypothetical protein
MLVKTTWTDTTERGLFSDTSEECDETDDENDCNEMR